MITPIPPPSLPNTPSPLHAKAAEMEAAFLSEMLQAAGLGRPSKDFGGGAGEEQFASFLREAQAKAIVQSGGLGLTEALFRSMGGKDDTA